MYSVHEMGHIYLTLQSQDGEQSLDHPGWEIYVTGGGDKGQLGHGWVVSWMPSRVVRLGICSLGAMSR